MEQGRLDFDETAQILADLSTKAQATFMYKMIGKMGPMMLRTIIRYCCRRLDTINEQLPETHPHKQRYLDYGRRSKGRFVTNIQTGVVHDAFKSKKFGGGADKINQEDYTW